MRPPPNHIFQHTPESLRAWFVERELPPFRADQVLDWVYRKGVVDPAAMSNLGKRDREALGAEMTFLSGGIIRHQTATDGTEKLLVEWSEADGSETARERDTETGGGGAEGERGRVVSLQVQQLAEVHTDRQTECVMIPSQDPTKMRRTACISSQVGCPVGCRFCASGLGGLDGNLTAGRIVEQVWRLNQMLRVEEPLRGSEPGVRQALRGSDPPGTGGADSRRSHGPEEPPRRGGLPLSEPPRELPAREQAEAKITHIVFMGMGEPLANLANVVHAVRTIAAPWGLGISARRITISTVGLPRAIEKLAEQLELPVTLALSLHAPNDELRRELIPWAEYTTIPELLAACQAWFRKTGREITLEYILLGDVNDRPEHAQQLAGVAKSLRANINLIRYNEVEPLPFRRPRSDDVHEFQRILRARGVNAHIRASRGRDIAAACGQLRHEAAS